MQNKFEPLRPNVPCQNCKRNSNLKCIWCDTIYCSVKCQCEDWNDHKEICLKSKGIVSELVLHDHTMKCPRKLFDSHIVKDLNIMKQKRLEKAGVFKKPTISVQHRLKDACLKDSNEQSRVPVKVPDSNYVEDSLNKGKLMKKQMSSPSLTLQDEIIEIEDEPSKDNPITFIPNRIVALANKVKNNRKWKDIEMPKHFDEDGYFKAIITDFSTPKLGRQTYIVSPVDLKDQYLTHLRQLQQVYKSAALESLSRDKIKKHDLVVAFFGITWHRATVLEINDSMIVVRSIETGITGFVKDLSKIKAPLPAELQKKAFTIEVIFENGNDNDIDLNSVVSMKLMSEFSGTNLATLKINKEIHDKKADDSNVSEDDELFRKFESNSITEKQDLSEFEATSDVPVKQEVMNKVEVTSLDLRKILNKPLDERKYLNRQMVKDFHTGDNIKLTFLDGSQLSNGLAHVCEFLPENVEFYMKIDKEIEEYIANNADQGNYKPAVNELVLAMYNDGLYYRGVCETIKDGIAVIYFLDYGGFEDVKIEKIIKIPSNLLYTICAHTCRLKLSEGEISYLNRKATVNKLFEQQHFTCNVQKLKNDKYPYELTIDKSLVVLF